MKGRIRIETVEGNAPQCPKCGNWNAMLDRFDWTGPDREDRFECRDCGFKVRKDAVIVVVKELDKPGMGAASTYTPVREVPGESY